MGVLTKEVSRMPAHTKRKSPWWGISVAFFAVLFALSTVVLLRHYLPDPKRPALVEKRPPASATSEAPALPDNPIDFDALQAQNPEIVAWISVPGTHIDYAVLHSGKDASGEDHYLYRDEEGNYRRAGSIYIQKQNAADFTDPNTLIYGHYMRNGSMFADLHRFRKDAFFEENDTIYIYMPGHIVTYRIYSAFVFDDRHILDTYDFHDPDGFSAFLGETLEPTSTRRQVRDGVTVTNADRLITLSTCTARKGERYLVVGKLIHDKLTD